MTNPWTRRTFLGALSAAAVNPKTFAQAGDRMNISPASHRVLLGTQGKVSRGIYSASFNPATGALGPLTFAAEVAAPTFLALHTAGSQQRIYAVSEVEGPGASVSAFTVSKDAETLTLLNRQPTEGDGPTHLSLTPDGSSLAVANYGGGSITTYRLGEDGTLSAPVTHIQYTGSGPDPKRQTSPHAHSAQFSPDGRWLLVNDLGLDRINVYRHDLATARITPADPPFWSARPGAGPRHISFHPNGHWLYSVNEMEDTVDQLEWNSSTGHLTSLSHVSTLPPGFPPHTAQAGEILCSHDGKQLYIGNRIAADTVAVFDLNPNSGALTLKQLAPNGGKTTRHLTLDPTGRWMLLSNQDSGNLVVLERNPATGELSPPRHTYPLDSAMFALFLP